MFLHHLHVVVPPVSMHNIDLMMNRQYSGLDFKYKACFNMREKIPGSPAFPHCKEQNLGRVEKLGGGIGTQLHCSAQTEQVQAFQKIVITHQSTSHYLQQWFCASLVPRPFPPPVFDCLQYANTEGEGLGDLVTCGYIR